MVERLVTNVSVGLYWNALTAFRDEEKTKLRSSAILILPNGPRLPAKVTSTVPMQVTCYS